MKRETKTLMAQRKPAPPAEPWIVRHWQQVLLALGVGLAAVLVTALALSRLKKAEEGAWERVSFAMSQAAQGRRSEAMTTLEGALAARRSGAPAVQALLLKSELLLSEGKNEEALAAAREALRQAATPEYKALATLSLAYALDQAGRPGLSADEYARFIAENPDHFMVPRASFQVGRLRAAQGNLAEAKAAYEKLITLYPATLWAKDAKAALAALNAQMPSK